MPNEEWVFSTIICWNITSSTLTEIASPLTNYNQARYEATNAAESAIPIPGSITTTTSTKPSYSFTTTTTFTDNQGFA